MKYKLAALIGVLAVVGLGGYAVSQDGVEFDTDRAGGDYRDFVARPGATYQVCAKACAEERRCRAWTYVPQGDLSPEGPHCWLKDSVPGPGRVGGLVSGLRGFGVAPVNATPRYERSRPGRASEPGGHAARSSGAPKAQGGRLTLFEGGNFGGRSVSLNRDTPSLHTETLQFGDSTWSLAAEGRWSVCEHVDYGGECRIYEGDHATLESFGGTISSARRLGPAR